MVKEWMYRWSSRRSGSKSGKRGGNILSSKESGGDTENSNVTPTGCINTVFQLFDFHPFHFSNNLHHHHHSTIPQEPAIRLTGAEAPRNSLEIYDGTNYMEAAVLSSSTKQKKDQTLNFKEMKIKTRSWSRRDDNLSTYAESSSSMNSPSGTKTPTLVARLMGLDLLPETSSPRPSSSLSTSSPKHSANCVQPLQIRSKSKRQAISSYESNNDFSSRSLPETPRTSATRSDVDIQRFSLQINKENNEFTNSGTRQEFDFSKFLTSKINSRRNKYENDENMRRPGEYAKEIVKEFKESISSRRVVGRDITNTNTLTHHLHQRRDQNVVLLTSKKPSNLGDINVSQNPCTLVAAKNKQSKWGTVSSIIKVQEETQKQPLLKHPPQTWDLIRNKQDEPLVRSAALITSNRAFRHSENNKCKRTPSPLPQRRSLLKKQDMQKQKQWEASHDVVPSRKNRTTTTTTTQSSSRNQSHSNKQHHMNINCMGVLKSEQLTDYSSRIVNCTPILSSSFKYEKEGDGMVMEIEGYIVEKLMHETVMAMF